MPSMTDLAVPAHQKEVSPVGSSVIIFFKGLVVAYVIFDSVPPVQIAHSLTVNGPIGGPRFASRLFLRHKSLEKGRY